MIDIRPDDEISQQEFEEITKDTWVAPKISRPNWQKPNLGWVVNRWVIALVAILIVLFGGRWVHHVLKNDDKKVGGSVTQPLSPDTKSKPSTPPTPVTKPATTPAATPTVVPNTGPGDTAAIFAVATVIAGATHYFVYSKRQARY